MYFVYSIFNEKNNKIYVGQTEDLDRRILFHNQKKFGGWTASFDGEWKLIYSEQVGSRKDALIREKQLKSYRGRQFIKQHIPR
ncbi:MAG: GIY-YIG nuclease family protein [Patescibacteria group bacterium]